MVGNNNYKITVAINGNLKMHCAYTGKLLHEINSQGDYIKFTTKEDCKKHFDIVKSGREQDGF